MEFTDDEDAPLLGKTIHKEKYEDMDDTAVEGDTPEVDDSTANTDGGGRGDMLRAEEGIMEAGGHGGGGGGHAGGRGGHRGGRRTRWW